MNPYLKFVVGLGLGLGIHIGLVVRRGRRVFRRWEGFIPAFGAAEVIGAAFGGIFPALEPMVAALGADAGWEDTFLFGGIHTDD